MAAFEEEDTICWTLDESQLQAVYNGNIGDYISCNIPITTPIVYNNNNSIASDTISWNLSLYPSGNDHNTAQFSYISLHTRSESIPSNISNLYINCKICLNETQFLWTDTNINIHSKHLLHILTPKNENDHLQSKLLKSCKSISFSISVKINKITFKAPTPKPIPHSMQPHTNCDQKSDDLNYPPSDNEVINTKQTSNGFTLLGHDDETKANSYITPYHEQNEEFECFPATITPKFDHCIKWTLRNKQYYQFIHSEMGRSMDTNAFFIENFRFKLACFPNGHKQSHHGFVIIYLDILNIPDNIKNIRIHWTFYCPQTGTRSTSIKDLNNSRMGTMVWMPNSLRLNTLANMSKHHRITFVLEISIFSIEYYPKHINCQFQHIEQYKNHTNDKQFCHENVTLIWKLNAMRIDAMKHCANNQSFDSMQFDLWLLRLSPKGSLKEQNGFVVALKLLPYYLHRDITGLAVRICLNCSELGIEWNDIGSFCKSQRIYSCKWDISHVLDLEKVTLEEITLEFRVKIIKLFGMNDTQIGNVEKSKYLKRRGINENAENVGHGMQSEEK